MLPLRSTDAAEILAAGEAIEKTVLLLEAISTVLQVYVTVVVLLDSKELFSSLSSQRNTIDKSIHGDVNAIRFHHEIAVDVFCVDSRYIQPRGGYKSLA